MPARIFQNNFTTGVITPGMASRVDWQKYRSACLQIETAIPLAHGGIAKRPGTRLVDELPSKGRLVSFSYSRNENYLLVFLEKEMRVYQNGGVVLEEVEEGEPGPLVVTSPFTLAQAWEMTFKQSGDVVFIVHPDVAPQMLTRTGHADWAFTPMSFAPDISAPSAPTATATGFDSSTNNQTIDYKVAAIAETEEESYPSPAGSVVIPTKWTAGATIEITWSGVTGAVKYAIYKNQRGFYGWIGTVNATESLAFVDDNIEPSASEGPKEEKIPFADESYPSAVGIFQQRLMFGGTDNQPQAIWGSQPGSFKNFATSYPLKADDSFEFTLDSGEMNAIRHFQQLKHAMVVLTTGGEWTMTAPRNANSVNPVDGASFEPQSFFGSANVPPLVAGNSVLILQNSGKIVRDLFYTLTEEFTGMELSIVAEHFFYSPIVSWTWQNEPFHNVYAVRSDGVLLTMTYLREQEVYAWAKHETQGFFRAACTVREGANDRVYFLVERDEKFFLEVQELRQYGDAVADAFFVDCGLRYVGEPTSTISGLDHLAGQMVSILADGSPLQNQLVSETGTITLDRAASKVQAGLPIRSLIQPVDPELNGPDGPTFGKRKNVVRCTVDLRETSGLKIGPDEENLVAAKFPAAANWGDAPVLYTGTLDVMLPGAYRREATVVLVHDQPTPFTVRSLVLEINAEG